MAKKRDIPQEILHYTEREEYKERKRRRRIAFLEDFVFTLLIIVIVALSFYSGRLIERHFAISDKIKTHFYQKSVSKFIRI